MAGVAFAMLLRSLCSDVKDLINNIIAIVLFRDFRDA